MHRFLSVHMKIHYTVAASLNSLLLHNDCAYCDLFCVKGTDITKLDNGKICCSCVSQCELNIFFDCWSDKRSNVKDISFN